MDGTGGKVLEGSGWVFGFGGRPAVGREEGAEEVAGSLLTCDGGRRAAGVRKSRKRSEEAADLRATRAGMARQASPALLGSAGSEVPSSEF